MIYAVKHDGRHKARFVAGGHLTKEPEEIVYSSVLDSHAQTWSVKNVSSSHTWSANPEELGVDSRSRGNYKKPGQCKNPGQTTEHDSTWKPVPFVIGTVIPHVMVQFVMDQYLLWTHIHRHITYHRSRA